MLLRALTLLGSMGWGVQGGHKLRLCILEVKCTAFPSTLPSNGPLSPIYPHTLQDDDAPLHRPLLVGTGSAAPIHGRALAMNTCATPPIDCIEPVLLGTAENFAILAKSGITTLETLLSAITGDIGVSPIEFAAMTGFKFTMDTFGTSAQLLTGKAYAADLTDPTPSELTTAVSDMETAYTDAAGRPNADAARINLGAGILGVFGGSTAPLTPGVYTFGTGVNIAADIYFQGTGTGVGQGDTDIFIIQVAGNLLVPANMHLTNGALAKNIFWQVAGFVEVGAGNHMEGVILGATAATFITGSSLNGRVLVQTACALQKATITQPAL
jgi:hypothetical protein